MPRKYYDPVVFDGSETQQVVREAVDVAIRSFTQRPPISCTPQAFTQCIVRQLLAAVPTAERAVLDDAEYFIASHGTYVFGHPHYVSLPILSIVDGCRVTEYSTGDQETLRDSDGREIVFTQVLLGHPYQHDGVSLVLGAYARGCMFVVTPSFEPELRFRWNLARGFMATRSLGITDSDAAVDALAHAAGVNDSAVYLLGHHLCRITLANSDVQKTGADSEMPLWFRQSCEREMIQQLFYHEIAGHYIHDLMYKQAGEWRRSMIPLAEARAHLCEIAYSRHPLVGLYDLFARREPTGERSPAFALMASRLRPAVSNGDLDVDENELARRLTRMGDQDIREIALNALYKLDQSFRSSKEDQMPISSIKEALDLMARLQSLVATATGPKPDPSAVMKLGEFVRENRAQIDVALQYLEENLPTGDPRRAAVTVLKNVQKAFSAAS